MSSLTSEEILTLIETQISSMHLIRQQAPIRALNRALKLTTNPRAQQILCDMLGFRHAKSAVPLLITCLNAASASVRSSAADALGKIGDARAGQALLDQFKVESELPVKRMLAAVLGAVGHREAIPFLIATLQETDSDLRGNAAWALGFLRAKEAEIALRQALIHEQQEWAKAKIHEALAALR